MKPPAFLAPLLSGDAGRCVLLNQRAETVASDLCGAFDSRSRRKGLLGRDRFEEGQGIVIAPCNAVHTFFMRFTIDVVHVDRAGRVLRVREGLRPWRVDVCLHSYAAIELPAGTAARLRICRGDVLRVQTATGGSSSPCSDTDPTEPPGRSTIDRRAAALTVAGALATASLLRAARGYRPFPSFDDFAYLPMALARLDPSLYPRDVMLRETPLHVPLLTPVVGILQATVGLHVGFWLLTIALSLLAVLALHRWMRALGLPGALLPVAAIIACAGRVQGLGRGGYDGVFGDGFHFQWAALCTLLWAYDALLRARWVRTAGLLLLALLCHPVVGVHGVVATGCGLAFARLGLTRLRSWLIPTAAGACALLGVWVCLLLERPGGDAVAALPDAVQGLLFRLPLEYDLHRLPAMLLLVLATAGVAGVVRLARGGLDAPVALLLGLSTGHVLLMGAACVLYEAHVVPVWSPWTLLPFQLSLTRTTPLLLALSGVSVAAGLEAGFLRAPQGDRFRRDLPPLPPQFVQVATVVSVALLHVNWSWQVWSCCGIAALNAVAIRRSLANRILTALWTAALVGGLVLFGRAGPLTAPVNDEQQALFSWARSNTPADALFIIPPSLQAFRLCARRSVFVDFKTVTPGDARLVTLWRQRLELVAAPDRLARDARGWAGVPEWDRTYAGRNTPGRVDVLLRETGADYFVWDRKGLTVPPFVSRERESVAELVTVFTNSRYEVYRRIGSVR